MSTHLNLWNHFHALLITLQLPLQVIRNQFLVRRSKPEPRKHRRRSYRDLYSPRYPTNHLCLSRTRSSFHIDLCYLYLSLRLCIFVCVFGKWGLWNEREMEFNGISGNWKEWEIRNPTILLGFLFVSLSFFLSLFLFGCFASSSSRSLELCRVDMLCCRCLSGRV